MQGWWWIPLGHHSVMILLGYQFGSQCSQCNLPKVWNSLEQQHVVWQTSHDLWTLCTLYKILNYGVRCICYLREMWAVRTYIYCSPWYWTQPIISEENHVIPTGSKCSTILICLWSEHIYDNQYKKMSVIVVCLPYLPAWFAIDSVYIVNYQRLFTCKCLNVNIVWWTDSSFLLSCLFYILT